MYIYIYNQTNDQLFKILEEYYLEFVKSNGISDILKNIISNLDVDYGVEEFLGYLLLLSCKHEFNELVNEITNIMSKKILKKENVHKIMHFAHDGHTYLYFINKRNNLRIGLELLHMERFVHHNRSEALKCIRKNAGKFRMDSWFIDTYKIVHPKQGFGRKASAVMAVVLQVFLSLIFYGSDFVTDIFLCKQYWTMAYDTNNAMNNSICSVKTNYESCLSTEILSNNSMLTSDSIQLLVNMVENVNCSKSKTWISCIDFDIEETQKQYIPAYYMMLMTILISSISYLWIAYNTKIKVRGSSLKKLILMLFWPVNYMFEEYKLGEDSRLELGDSLKSMESSWKLLKSIENGIENYIQFFIQLFLLTPYISFLLTLPIKELFWMGVANLIGIFDPPETLCGGNGGPSALGKLFLSVMSLSYGTSSRQAARRGQTLSQSIKNLVLWLSYLLLCFARIISIFSLLALDNPVLPALTFASIHFAFVLVILVITKEFNGCLNEIVPCFLTCMASHTVVINFHHTDQSASTVIKQLLFHSIVMIENMILLMMPLIWTEIYPSTECFKITSSELYIVGPLWSTGICFLVSFSGEYLFFEMN